MRAVSQIGPQQCQILGVSWLHWQVKMLGVQGLGLDRHRLYSDQVHYLFEGKIR